MVELVSAHGPGCVVREHAPVHARHAPARHPRHVRQPWWTRERCISPGCRLFRCDAKEALEGPYGIRTRAAAVRGRCPRPLDEWAVRRGIVPKHLGIARLTGSTPIVHIGGTHAPPQPVEHAPTTTTQGGNAALQSPMDYRPPTPSPDPRNSLAIRVFRLDLSTAGAPVVTGQWVYRLDKEPARDRPLADQVSAMIWLASDILAIERAGRSNRGHDEPAELGHDEARGNGGPAVAGPTVARLSPCRPRVVPLVFEQQLDEALIRR